MRFIPLLPCHRIDIKVVKNIVIFCLLTVLNAGHNAFADLTAFTQKTVPYYLSFEQLSIPSGYLDRGDTLTIDSMRIDREGVPWLEIYLEKGKAFIRSSNIKYIINRDSAESVSSAGLLRKDESDSLRKQRILLLREHRDWPIRIKRLVREGRVALDMSHEQVKAAWNTEPDIEIPGFIFGIGEVVFCYYRLNKDEDEILVVLKNNRVVGWSSN